MPYKTAENYSCKRKFRQDDSPAGFDRKRLRKNGRHWNTKNDGSDQQRISGYEQNEKYVAPDIKECVVYYEKILQSLRQGSELTGLSIYNALQESTNKEVELCCHNIGSHCLELLLTDCKDDHIIKRFMSAFAKAKISVSTSANASHVTELLIFRAIQAIQNWPKVLSLEDDEQNEQKEFVTYCINWLTELGEFALEYLSDCLFNSYSCHVVCTLIRALSGYISKKDLYMSKKLQYHKEELRSNYAVQHVSESIKLEHIPESFSTILKKLYKSLVKLEDLFDCAAESSSSTVIQALLSALKSIHPKSCKKMVIKTAKNLLAKRDSDGTPSALLHTKCSFVFDEMFKVADEDLQLQLWNQYIADYLGKLVKNSVGNYVIQRIYQAVKSKSHFEIMCEATWCLFGEILRFHRVGIFFYMAMGCIQMKTQQSSFMKNIMQCFNCFEPAERQDLLIPLLLRCQTYDEYMASSHNQNPFIHSVGSLLVQALFRFEKPLKVVKSMLSMSATELQYLAGHKHGCHVWRGFFVGINVGEKNKEKLLLNLKPVIVSIACNGNESLTLARVWVLLSMKLKEVFAKILIENEEVLQASKSGNIILKKFGIFHFRRNYQKWKEIQSNLKTNDQYLLSLS